MSFGQRATDRFRKLEIIEKKWTNALLVLVVFHGICYTNKNIQYFQPYALADNKIIISYSPSMC